MLCWCAAVVLYVGAVEAGIITEPALGIHMRGMFSCVDQLFCFDQPLNSQIGFDRNTGGLAEYPAKLRAADIKCTANIGKRNRLVQIIIEIAHDLMGDRIRDWIHIFGEACVDAAKLMQQRNQSGKNADAGIGPRGHHGIKIVFAAAKVEVVAFVEILRSGGMGQKWRRQISLGIDCF